MRIKAAGSSAFTIVIVAGLLAFYAGPVKACEPSGCKHIVLAQNSDDQQAQIETVTSPESVTDTETRPKKRWRHVRKSSRSDKSERLASQSSSVTNANAQMGAVKVGRGKTWEDKTWEELTKSLPEKTRFADGAGLANDLDRAASGDKPAPEASRPVAEPAYIANSGADDTWNQTSFIGKIFIAFGGFLTLASAVRMFMA